MERTLKSRAPLRPRQGQPVFLLPGGTEAEPWEAWLGGGAGGCEFAQAFPTPRQNPWAQRSVLALPTAQVFCVPLWLNEAQPGRLPEMIALQLEARGLAGSADRPAVYQWSTVLVAGTRTLVVVGLLPTELPLDLQVGAYRSFDVAARFYDWPADAITLWMEQGKLAVVFTRAEELIYFQNLGEGGCSERVVQALTCIRASLEMSEQAVGLTEIVLCVEATPAEQAALAAALQLPVRTMDQPAPEPPTRSWNLAPPEVVRFKQRSHSRQWKWRGLALAGVLYVMIVAVLLGRFWWTAHQVAILEKWQDSHAAEVAVVQRGQADWRRLQPVVDTGNYPLEVLRNCADAIPNDQLHLTLFEFDHDKVVLRGEAKNVSAAYLLLDHLKSEKQLAAYTWRMDEPHLLPNDLAQLQIEGTHANANP